MAQVQGQQGAGFVIGGYTPDNPLDAVIVGYYDGDKLIYAAKVRNGFRATITPRRVAEAETIRDRQLSVRQPAREKTHAVFAHP